MDASQPAIDLALREAEAEALDATFLCSDAGTIDLAEEFDAAICIGTLGLGEDREDHQRFLDSAARALAAGGRILIDTINLFWHVRHQDPETWYELDDGALVLGKGEFDPAIRCLSPVVYPSGGTEERRFVVRLYTLLQLREMFRAAGLRLQRTWGTSTAARTASTASGWFSWGRRDRSRPPLELVGQGRSFLFISNRTEREPKTSAVAPVRPTRNAHRWRHDRPLDEFHPYESGRVS